MNNNQKKFPTYVNVKLVLGFEWLIHKIALQIYKNEKWFHEMRRWWGGMTGYEGKMGGWVVGWKEKWDGGDARARKVGKVFVCTDPNSKQRTGIV